MRRRLTSRLDALVPRVDPPAQFKLVVISPETWSEPDLAAYDAARELGDTDEQDRIIWRVTGQQVNRAAPGVHTIRCHAPVRILEIRGTAESGP